MYSTQHGWYYIIIIDAIKPPPLITSTYNLLLPHNKKQTRKLMANTLTSHLTRRGVSCRQQKHIYIHSCCPRWHALVLYNIIIICTHVSPTVATVGRRSKDVNISFRFSFLTRNFNERDKFMVDDTTRFWVADCVITSVGVCFLNNIMYKINNNSRYTCSV